MLKEHSSFLKQTIAFLDCCLILVSFYCSYLIVSLFFNLAPLYNYWVMLVGFLGFYLYFAWTRSLFSILQFSWLKNLNKKITMIFLSAGILGAAILYVIPDKYNSRSLYLAFALLSFTLIFFEKLILCYFFTRIRKNNKNTTPILFFGRGRSAARLVKEIRSHPEWGLRIIHIVDAGSPPEHFEEILKNCYVEEVFFSIPRSFNKSDFAIDPYLHICEEMGRPARVFMNISEATHFARWTYHEFLDRPTFISHTVELDPDQLIFKRIFDVMGSLAGIAALCVVYPVFSLLIKVSSAGPVFFRQVRVGKNGKRFIIYKFRTMYIDAEKRKEELLKKNELKGAIFKIKDDPRITNIGKVLRRLSMDELPQFINVLKGQMSLVGTRPPTPDEVSQYQKWHHRRISIKPGITGLWQTSGRNKITNFDEVVALDLEYIDNWSIWLDIKVILKTIVVLFQRDEAY
jgi:exopolysaccharide biosynthesis polyprenyl glycosylphosphotransferase